MDLSFRLAKQRDHRNKQLHEAGRPIPMNLFKKHFYRQPVLSDGALYPEPYRKIDSLDSTSVDGSVDMEKGRRASTRNQPSTVSSNATTTAAAGQGAVFSPLHSHSQSQPQAIPQSDPDENPADTDTNTGTNAHPHQSQFETRMRASSMDMHRVEDEVEDPPIVLEQYFREYVLPLTDPEYQAPSSTSNAQTSTKRKNSFF